MKPELAAYFAGWFDGEGSIGIYFGNGPVRMISGVGSYLQTLEDLMEWFSGRIAVRDPKYITNRQTYTWVIGAKSDIERFLVTIRPYLREKAEQADIMLAEIRDEIDTREAAAQLKALKR